MLYNIRKAVMQAKNIRSVYKNQPTMEGAGVSLNRVFGYYQVPEMDPFLLLDDFHSNDPKDYIAGFPWHPHRGIETVTYMLSGKVEHGDSIGNSGAITAGDVQWMTAGSGIVHQEMPKQVDEELWGFQLWVNLPKKHKMTKPRYQEIKKDEIPEITLDNNIKIKIIAGHIADTKGPVQEVMAGIEYLDIHIPKGTVYKHPAQSSFTSIIYAVEGEGLTVTQPFQNINKEHCYIYDEGDYIHLEAAKQDLRVLYLSGKPLNEPVAWRGPIVMNTDEELETAFFEYQNNSFIK
jgi:redox-sensitive bicupin YhaK (pirin superfamily)